MQFRVQMGIFASMVMLAGTSAFADLTRTPAGLIRPEIERELQRSSKEFRIPYALLASIAFIESRWSAVQPDGEHAPVYGVMGLRDDDWFGHSLSIAARLVNLPAEKLKTDVAANIRGASRYLRVLQGPGHTKSVLDWKDAVLKFTGIPALEDRELYWDDLIQRMAYGYSRDGIHIPADPSLLRHVSHKKSSDDEPVIEWDPSPNFNPGDINPRYVTIHTTQGSFASSVSWLKNPLARASAHYVIRASDGFIKQLVSETDRAWHARCWNPVAIGIEHEGFVDDPTSYTEPQVKASVALTKRILSRFSIPADDMHVFGHDFWTTDRYQAGHPDDLPNCNDHTDPGMFWDWIRYFELLLK